MRNGILAACVLALTLNTCLQSAKANDYATSQVPPNQPLQIQNEAPPAFPPLAQALHVEAIPDAGDNQANPAVAQPAAAVEPLRLPPPSKAQEEGVAMPTFNFQSNQTASIAASLFVVVGLFLIFAWVGKKNMKSGSGRLSKEIIQVLGKSQLSGKQQLELVRVGQKLLLLCVTPNGVETLTEITEPTEVERLLTIVRQDSPGSMTATFQDVLSQMGHQPARGFLEA
ncbi:Flagellar biosynthesis protein, FliO [Bremerella volcania]|uniref:Flagellar biosynthesis protein, FliO n=1 Tax=Bremerella volcania TaxID=2527984 RepID=A0A518C5D6_9BACT|nr:flagellar biosynthetic protein FliO [Bremerella volcania]QDU74432.1 Flagellar biosynthesis protein, FliO [Bremerella volcania]